MNFEDVQVIWDSQKDEPMMTMNKDALVRIVEKQSIAIHRDLKLLEVTAIVMLIGLGIATLIDTFFNGKEYFQLWSVAFEFSAACFLWFRRRRRERGSLSEPLNLMQRIDLAISQSRTTVQRGRDMAIVFSAFVLYGVAIRIWIYGWRGSEIKLLAAVFCVAMLLIGMKVAEWMTHEPRMKNLSVLREKLLGDS